MKTELTIQLYKKLQWNSWIFTELSRQTPNSPAPIKYPCSLYDKWNNNPNPQFPLIESQSSHFYQWNRDKCKPTKHNPAQCLALDWALRDVAGEVGALWYSLQRILSLLILHTNSAKRKYKILQHCQLQKILNWKLIIFLPLNFGNLHIVLRHLQWLEGHSLLIWVLLNDWHICELNPHIGTYGPLSVFLLMFLVTASLAEHHKGICSHKNIAMSFISTFYLIIIFSNQFVSLFAY